MFWSKTVDPNPLGVPLGDLLQMLKPTTIKAHIEGNVLIAKHEHYTTRVEVVPPDRRESPNGPIKAVVRIRTNLPEPLLKVIDKPEMTVAVNAFAALGAMTYDAGKIFVGSRLTIYEAENAWRTLQLPMVLFTIITGAEAHLGGLRRSFSGEPHRGGSSSWAERDFEYAEKQLSKICVCTSGGLGLTAEFGLRRGEISAAQGDHATALFELMADQPHPELGGGLFCLLQLPHRIEEEGRLQQLCVHLNKLEMEAKDLAPHFGAWCEGRMGNNLAYASYLMNPLHEVNGVALNTAYWAISRAHWAFSELAAHGIHA